MRFFVDFWPARPSPRYAFNYADDGRDLHVYEVSRTVWSIGIGASRSFSFRKNHAANQEPLVTPTSRINLAVPAASVSVRAESGSEGAPETLTATDMFREHGRYAFRLLRRLGVHEADVDDVLQEVFVAVHRKAP